MAFLKKLFAAIRKKFIKSTHRKKSIQRLKKKTSYRKKPVHRKRTRILRKRKVSRRPSRKPLKRNPKSHRPKKLQKQKSAPRQSKEPVVGEITHFFSKIRVCVIKVTGEDIVVGDTIRIKGATTNFAQKIRSLQIENSDVKIAHRGQLAGLKVDKKTRAGDLAFKVLPK